LAYCGGPPLLMSAPRHARGTALLHVIRGLRHFGRKPALPPLLIANGVARQRTELSHGRRISVSVVKELWAGAPNALGEGETTPDTKEADLGGAFC